MAHPLAPLLLEGRVTAEARKTQASFPAELPLRGLPSRAHRHGSDKLVYDALREIALPEISRFFGIVVAMFYHDHPPPHFHVR
jgi:hypothetical protein